jgi:23S rRNA (adenine2503-C2)-methyltransferase
MAKLHELFGPDQRPVMLQYTMIAGVNDDLEEARRLAALVRGLNAKVNLIPLNEVSASRLSAPSSERIQAFRDILHAAGLRVMVRYSKAQDIGGACGQLIVQGSNLKRA